MTIDAKVASLKEKYHQRNLPMMDQVCIECLIRANFDENEALKLLRNNPPNLVWIGFYFEQSSSFLS